MLARYRSSDRIPVAVGTAEVAQCLDRCAGCHHKASVACRFSDLACYVTRCTPDADSGHCKAEIACDRQTGASPSSSAVLDVLPQLSSCIRVDDFLSAVKKVLELSCQLFAVDPAGAAEFVESLQCLAPCWISPNGEQRVHWDSAKYIWAHGEGTHGKLREVPWRGPADYTSATEMDVYRSPEFFRIEWHIDE